MTAPAVRAHFRAQAQACEALGSPFTASVCRVLAERLDGATATGRAVLDWPGDPRADALSLRLCGGLHALVLSGADPALATAYPPNATTDLPALLDAALRRNDAALLAALERPPQTNEIARAAMLLPGFLLAARETGLPLAVAEIGASAGLNLNFDRFRYRYGEASWGEPGAAVVLAPEVRGESPPLSGELSIASRAGCDVSPVDVSDPAERLRLRSYVWADQAARLARLDSAIAIALDHPCTPEPGDAGDFVRAALARRRRGETFVVVHSIMWQYMPAASKAAVGNALEEAGRAATPSSPVARLRMEPLGPQPFATLSLTLWPGGETRRLARCDYHGRWIEWL